LAKNDEEGLIVFVPGLAFDLHGNRLGRGKGWYDRALASLGGQARFIALAFEFQIVDEVPTDSWDRKVHHIITERRIIDCGDLPSDSGWLRE
jgi:5-formyltetrahydrofolate cyclo-ligase